MMQIRRLLTRAERAAAQALLEENGLRLDGVLDALYGAYEDGALLGCGGYAGPAIRCVAVSSDARGEGVMSALISYIVTELKSAGQERIFVFTRPQSARRFMDLGFYPLAETEDAALLENRANGLASWLAALPRPESDDIGAVVLHGNPFTKGHRYLIEQAAGRCGALYLFVLSEDGARFSAEERLAMARAGCGGMTNVLVCAGGPYCISKATFPDYFLKRAGDAARVCAELDAGLFASRIAPALHIRVRFAGSEPLDALTNAYNEALARLLPAQGLGFQVIPRLCLGGAPVSASRLRALLDLPDFAGAAELAPESTRPYLIGRLAYEALLAEAEAAPKPGLVDRENSGAHRDMDIGLLRRSAQALRPYFTRFALRGQREAVLPLRGRLDALRPLGLEAESAMLAATGGVNTHRGAIFTLGIFAYLAGRSKDSTPERLCADAALLCAGLCRELPEAQSHGGRMFAAYGARGPRGEAEDGYPSLTRVALPAYAAQRARGLPENDALCWALMHLISETCDSNLLYRGGPSGAAYAREAAAAFLAAHDPGDADCAAALRRLDGDFSARGLSPGGSADLLAAARFLYSLSPQPAACGPDLPPRTSCGKI